MIKSLHIENIAVIESTDIEFKSGFNVLTGETGAGKSIIIDSINAVLGERTSKELIRTGCEKAEVTALFGNLSPEALTALEDSGYKTDEDGNLLVMRILSASGAGSVKINGKPATVGILKDLSKYLVNIHGQHDNQSLLNPDTHIGFIDKLASNKPLCEEYYAEFKRLNSIRKELNSLETDEDEKNRRAELLKYQINEIESAKVTVGEAEKLKNDLKLADAYESTVKALGTAYFMLNGNESSLGAVSLVRNAQAEISALSQKRFDEITLKFNEALALLEDIAFEIRKCESDTESTQLDPETVRGRLDTLRSLMLKYGGGEEEVLHFCENAKTELEGIFASGERIAELSEMLDLSTEKLVEIAERLTKSRQAAAKLFSGRITEKLAYLNMPDSEFAVSEEKGKYTKNGCDVMEFLIKTNAGDNKKPLCKIASGGELSRIMLSIKSVLADRDDVDTLIFDEIDSGISGRAADKVGKELKAVSKSRQVICVTHLSQIASFADNHFLIDKAVSGGKTYTTVKLLSYEERIKEIARIMSGTDITENLYNTAKELLDRSM